MGRKPIPPNQRAQPISFSLKPHLIEKIDDYCHDHRFNRSKFLMEAVTQYMLKNDLNHFTSNIRDMGIDQRIAVGLAALQEANHTGVPVRKHIMDALRRELGVNTSEEQPSLKPVRILRETGTVHSVLDHRHTVVAQIVKKGRKFSLIPNEISGIEVEIFRTLREAKERAQGVWG